MKANSQWPIFRPRLYFEPTQLLQEFEKEAEKAPVEEAPTEEETSDEGGEKTDE